MDEFWAGLLERFDGASVFDDDHELTGARAAIQGVLSRGASDRAEGMMPEGGYRSPLAVQFEYTNRCVMDCLFCYNDSRPSPKTSSMGREEILRIAREIADLDVLKVVLSGGEVFIDRDLLFSLVEILNDHAIRPTILTSGWFLDEALADRLARRQIQSVQVSVDGADEAAHDELRRKPGGWRRAVRALRLLDERGFYTTAGCLITERNRRTLDDYFDLCLFLGVDQVALSFCIDQGRARDHRERLEVDDSAFEDTVEMIVRKRKQYADLMRIDLSQDPGFVRILQVLWMPTNCLIRPDGSVARSCVLPIPLGNVRERSLKEIWDSEFRRLPANPSIRAFLDGMRIGTTPRLGMLRSSLGGGSGSCQPESAGAGASLV